MGNIFRRCCYYVEEDQYEDISRMYVRYMEDKKDDALCDHVISNKDMDCLFVHKMEL